METKKKKDKIVLLEPMNEKGTNVLKVDKEGVRPAVIKPHKEGAPLLSDGLVRLEETGCPIVYESTSLWEGEGKEETKSESSSKGPAKVNSPAFRANWDQIFGGGDGELPN